MTEAPATREDPQPDPEADGDGDGPEHLSESLASDGSTEDSPAPLDGEGAGDTYVPV